MDSDLLRQAVSLRNDGHSYRSIGRTLGVTHATIRRWLIPGVREADNNKNAEWYQKNKDRVQDRHRQYSSDYRSNNLDKVRQTQRNCYQQNKSWYLDRNAKRRAELKEQFSYWCQEVQQQIEDIYDNCPADHHVDHIQPLSRGGIHHPVNLQYLPVQENLQKGNNFPLDDQSLLAKRLFHE